MARSADIALGGLAAWLVAITVTSGSLGSKGPVAALLVLAALLAVVASYIEQWAAHDGAFRIIAELRTGMFEGIRRSAPRLLLDRRSGDVAAAAMADSESLEWFYAHTVATYIVAMVVPLGAVAVLVAISWPVAAVVASTAVAVAIVPAVLARRAAIQGDAVREAAARIQADALEGLQALRDIVLLRAEEALLAQVRQGATALAQAQETFGRRRGTEIAVTDALLGIGVLAILAVAGDQVVTGAIAAARLPVLVVLTGAVLAPVASASASAALLGQTRASAARVLAVLDAPENVVGAERPNDPVRPDPQHDPVAELCDARFRYPGARHDALRGVSFAVHRGEMVALAGRTGAGKTTCASLLLRLWDVSEGSIRLGGKNIRRIPRADLARFLAWVPQESGLLQGSVRDALRLRDPAAPDASLLAAVSAVGADDVLVAIGGLDGQVGEGGATLSGGQRQKLALARALVPSPPFLVLDEPVSHVDAAGSDQALASARAAAELGAGVLLIAHRRETLLSADRVVVLANGVVVQDGPPHDLLAQEGALRHIVGQHS